MIHSIEFREKIKGSNEFLEEKSSATYQTMFKKSDQRLNQ